MEVTLRVRPAALPRLRRLVAVTGQHRVDVTAAGEWIELTVPFDGEQWARTALLGLGGQVQVLGPPRLRAAVAAEAAVAAAYYATDRARAGGSDPGHRAPARPRD